MNLDDNIKTPHPNCLICTHFYVTWDAQFPRGCHQFSVKSKSLPSVEIFLATGHHCPSFLESKRIIKVNQIDELA